FLPICQATAVANTYVSPYVARTAPSACLAKCPVSSRSVRPATSSSTVCAMGPLSFVIRGAGRCPRIYPAGRTASRTDRCPPATPGCEGPAGRPPSDRRARLLAPDPQSRDHGLVALLIIAAELIQQRPPPAHHDQPPAW